MTVLIDNRDLDTLDAPELRALVIDVARERDVVVALLAGASHGMLRLRAFIDPSEPRKPPPPVLA